MYQRARAVPELLDAVRHNYEAERLIQRLRCVQTVCGFESHCIAVLVPTISQRLLNKVFANALPAKGGIENDPANLADSGLPKNDSRAPEQSFTSLDHPNPALSIVLKYEFRNCAANKGFKSLAVSAERLIDFAVQCDDTSQVAATKFSTYGDMV